ncbi:MAG: hypothetical protein ACXAEX_23800 [Promethearchaeota archaeon]
MVSFCLSFLHLKYACVPITSTTVTIRLTARDSIIISTQPSVGEMKKSPLVAPITRTIMKLPVNITFPQNQGSRAISFVRTISPATTTITSIKPNTVSENNRKIVSTITRCYL